MSPSVLITGSSSGIGEATALEFHRRGFQVFAGVRSEVDGERLRSQASPRLIPVRLDVTDESQIAEAAQMIDQVVGPAGLGGLVNNAGIVVAGPLEVLPLDEIRRQMEVNVIGHLAVTRAMLPMLRRARGRIVNVGSFNGRIAPPYMGAYAASKHAMEAISDVLRVELRAWKIHVALIEPGGTATPIWEKSLAMATDIAKTASPEALALYEAEIEAFRKAVHKMAESASTVDGSVRAIVHAMTARWPKTRYPVGLATNLLFRLRKWIPDRVLDWMIVRSLGLPGNSGAAASAGSTGSDFGAARASGLKRLLPTRSTSQARAS